MRLINLEMQLRTAPQMQPLNQLVPDVAHGASKPSRVSAASASLLDGDHDASRAPIVSQQQLGHVGEADARVSQLAFNDGFNLLRRSSAMRSR